MEAEPWNRCRDCADWGWVVLAKETGERSIAGHCGDRAGRSGPRAPPASPSRSWPREEPLRRVARMEADVEASMPNHLMVDLETLGREPGAVIVSIGAVKFDPSGETLGDKLYTNITIQSSLDAGLRVEGATIQWWMEQPDRARLALFHPDPLPLRRVLSAFARFYRGSESIWSHGSTFDIPILEVAYRALNEWRPWVPRAVRDTRTLFSLVPQAVVEGVQREGMEHHALDDAVRQARMVQAAYRWLRTRQVSG